VERYRAPELLVVRKTQACRQRDHRSREDFHHLDALIDVLRRSAFPVVPLDLIFESCRMRKFCVWLKPKAVAQIEVLEWTGADHPRRTKFVVTLRDDKDAQKVVRET
jgi:ATP-dependent DNA ligase